LIMGSICLGGGAGREDLCAAIMTALFLLTLILDFQFALLSVAPGSASLAALFQLSREL
jgi:hypothetical protein